ncbi:UV-B-induced protein, chloroplastic-like protein [Drosera capensis]
MFAFQCYPFGIPKLGRGVHKGRVKRMTIRAGESTSPNLEPVGPLNLESPVGQLLERVLQTHPHLLPATVDQQLENLQKIRDAEAKESATSSQDNLLYKRIAEVKEKERRKAVEEILYCLAVHKFVENGISMIPKIKPTSDPTGRVDFWPNQEQQLVSIHSTEALEMIQSHLSIVLGERYVGPLQNMVEISKIKLRKLYAASITYGYFIKRVDQRYQLEKSMNTLPKGFHEEEVSGFRRKARALGSRIIDPDPVHGVW